MIIHSIFYNSITLLYFGTMKFLGEPGLYSRISLFAGIIGILKTLSMHRTDRADIKRTKDKSCLLN